MISASIIIRTFNEAFYLEELILSILNQNFPIEKIEIIGVDSGSTDNTLQIFRKYKIKVMKIKKSDFSFGRSLNYGCNVAKNKILVFISAHCIPKNKNWLRELIAPISNESPYVYGRQVGGLSTKFSEKQIFLKYFPSNQKKVYSDFYINNANSAILKSIWKKYKFDESLTGLEDIHLAKRLRSDNYKIKYNSKSVVFHYHNESNLQIFNRFKRESLALQKISPEIHISFFYFIFFLILSIYYDFISAFKKRVFLNSFFGIISYRFYQYLGSYKGNHASKTLSKKMREDYFYPKS